MKNKNSFVPSTFISSRVTATISIALVLFLLGLIVLLTLLANNLSKYVKENITFDITLSDEISTTQVKKLQSQLGTLPFVKDTHFISKEDAFEQVKADLGQDAESFLGFNPMPAIVEVSLLAEYANNDSIEMIQSKIKTLSTNISAIDYKKDILQTVNENMRKLSFLILGLALILLLISFALINNTIRLMIYSKRFLIYTMKLIGATNGFIRRPFISSNLLSGIIASVLAMGGIAWLVYYLHRDIPKITEMVDIQSLGIVFASMIVMGILITLAATYFAVGKYLRMKGNDLYYI